MKILFIYIGGPQLGIEYLSSMLKSKGHQTSLLFDPAIFSGHFLLNIPLFKGLFSLDRKIIEQAVKQKPDLICFSCFTGNYMWSLNIAKNIKKLADIPIVFGGVHVTAVPELVLKSDCVDYVIVGEAEYALLDLVKHIESKKSNANLNIKNVGYKYKNKIFINPPRPYIRDLDSLPMPDKELFYKKSSAFKDTYSIMVNRGCPFACTYCSNNMYHKLYCNEKNHIRSRSVQNVIKELKIAKSKYNPKSIGFTDDVFTLSYDWLKEFIPLYKKEIGLKFSCLTQAMYMTPEIAAILKEGGCWSIGMGVQSGSTRIRREIFKRYETNEQITRACSIIKKAKIRIFVDFILGSPSETEEDIKESLKLLGEIKADRLLLFFLIYLPKTEIAAIGKNYGNINEQTIQDIEHGITSGYIHSMDFVKKKGMYEKYWLLFQLRVLFQNDILFNLSSKVAEILPFKEFFALLVTLLISIKIRNTRYLYYFKYIVSKKNVP